MGDKKDWSAFRIFGIGSAASLVSKVALVFISMLIMGINPLERDSYLERIP